jgi:hypothetical protein
VDSIAYACGGDAESSEVASRYKQHAHTLGVGSLHLAHVTKAGNTEKPFGSAFWHNSARSTWYVQAEDDPSSKGDVTEIDLKLFHRKNNSGPKESPRLIRLAINKRQDTIQIKSRAIKGRSTKAPSTPDRVKAALATGSATRDNLRQQLPDVDPETLRKTISRGVQDGWLKEDAEELSLAS